MTERHEVGNLSFMLGRRLQGELPEQSLPLNFSHRNKISSHTNSCQYYPKTGAPKSGSASPVSILNISGVDPCLHARIDYNINRHPAVYHSHPAPLHNEYVVPATAHRKSTGPSGMAVGKEVSLPVLSPIACISAKY